MSRNRGGGDGGFEGLVIWLVLFAFFGPVFAQKLTNSLGDVLVILAPSATVLVVVGVGLYLMRTR